MIKIAFNEALIKWKSTIISAILFGVILTLVVAGISTYDKLYSKYKPFKKLLDENGYFVMTHREATTKSLDDIMRYDAKADKWFTIEILKGDGENSPLIYNSSKITTPYEMIGYNKHIAGYIPDMKKGVWYADAESIEGQIEVVISSEDKEIKYDDYFTINGFDNVKFHVCGVTESDTNYFYPNGVTRYSSIYDYYRILSERLNTSLVLFADGDRLKENYVDGGMYEAPLVLGIFDKDFVPKNTSYDGSYMLFDSFSTVRENTIQKIKEELNQIIPVFIAIILLAILAIICAVAIDTTLSLNNYATLYISGMKWKDIIYINTIKAFIQATIGFILMFGMETFFNKLYGNLFVFALGSKQIVGCIIVCVIVFLISCVMPLVIIKSKSPAEVLRNSRIQ